MSLVAFGSGFSIGFGLIAAIGAQNAHILRQGIFGQQILPCITVCIFCDSVLMSIGVFGFGAVIEKWPSLAMLARIGGAFFLIGYGFYCFKNALQSDVLNASGQVIERFWTALVTTLAITLLNPHVYLDTIILIGGIGAQYGSEARDYFLLGAIFASWTWFSMLGYGASRLRPLFESPRAWRMLDILIGVFMWAIAVSLLFIPR